MPRRKKMIQSIKGMHDILPQDYPWWEFILKKAGSILEYYDFDRIETPILEQTDLLKRGIGPGVDLVEKEMYSFKTKGGDKVSLRPEGTAPIVRAYIEHGMFNLPQPVKLWYFGPMFRYEQPQAGRLRQFWQIGVEVIGNDNYATDTEIIFVLWKILEELKISSIVLQINSVGDENCQPTYKKSLKTFYKTKLKKVCPQCRIRFEKNILRMLDCTQEQCVEIANQAPQIIDFLDEDCKQHLKNILEFLDDLKIPYILNPYLVRGLDYYTRTVFEIWPEGESGRQIALAAGGRYNKLVEILGGPKTEAAGWAMGMERLINYLKSKSIKIPEHKQKPKVFLAQLGDLAKRKSIILMESFRKNNIPVAASFSRDSIKSQLRIANKMGVRFTLIFGQREALDENIILRDMESSVQEVVPIKEIIKVIKDKLKEKE